MLSDPAPATKKLQHKFKVLNPQGTLLALSPKKKGKPEWEFGNITQAKQHQQQGPKCPAMKKKSIQHPHQLSGKTATNAMRRKQTQIKIGPWDVLLFIFIILNIQRQNN